MGTPVWITILVGVLSPAGSLVVAFYVARSSLQRMLSEQIEAKTSELREQQRVAYAEYLRAYDSFGAASTHTDWDWEAVQAAMNRAVEALSYIDLYGSEEVAVVARHAQAKLLRFYAAKVAGDTGSHDLGAMSAEVATLRAGLVNILRLDLGMHEFNIPKEQRAQTRQRYADRLRTFASALEDDAPSRDSDGG